jgi:hypothetical protein
MCVELGMAKALVSELELLESSLHIPFSPGYIADKRKLVEYFSKRHRHHACACRGAVLTVLCDLLCVHLTRSTRRNVCESPSSSMGCG